ncbi:hypothetical protein ACFVMC_09770 [Nocardia sp. NPDC127579]|uniref:hypothetical protein n=1 Tax=Nocardia sp. NPDC127579 TaxID=3345402 RepID=UPI003630B341
MNGRTLARVAAAVTTLGIGAAMTLSGPASAEPAAPDLEGALTQLTAQAGTDLAAQAGVGALAQYTKVVDVAQLRAINGNWAPFAYAAPTFGCGSHGPITTIVAAANAEAVALPDAPAPNPGSLRFSATPAHTGIPLNSGLVVSWLNVNNGRSGLDLLDDRTSTGLPSLSRTVDTGPGAVIASMWGAINYPYANCVMTPTVGLFFVPDVPPPPAAPQAPASIDQDLQKPSR